MAEQVKRKKIFDFSLLRRVFHYTAPYRRRLYLSVILSIVLAVLAPLRPFLIQITINRYIIPGATATVPVKELIERALIWIMVLQIGLLLIETVSRFYF